MMSRLTKILGSNFSVVELLKSRMRLSLVDISQVNNWLILSLLYLPKNAF